MPAIISSIKPCILPAFTFFFFSITSVSFASHVSGPDSLATEITYRNRNTFLPAIGSTPETGMLFGGVIMRQFKPMNASRETRSSVMVGSAIYTVKKQLMIGIAPYIILNDEQWIIEGVYEYLYCPDSFWGIGSHTSNDAEKIYEYRKLAFVQSVTKRVGQDMFLGPVVRWSRTSDIEFSDKDQNDIERPDVAGAFGSTTAGFGITFRWDARNSLLTPTRNHLLSITTTTYPRFTGTTHPFTLAILDARKYFDFNTAGQSVVAVQFLGMLTSGSPSFMDMPALGGGNIMRGYYHGRYRDNNSVQIQGEFRQHLHGRFGVSLFAAAGEVWSDFGHFNLSNPKYAGGMGIRFNINKNDTTNLRLDYGVGRGVSGLYLTFGEAF